MLFTRKRSLSFDSFDSKQPMAKRARREVIPQPSPFPAPTKVDLLDKSPSLTPSPLSTITSSSPPGSPPPHYPNKPDSFLSASPSSSFDSLSPSLSPASSLSSLTPPSSPPPAASISPSHTITNALLPSDTSEALSTCYPAKDVTTDEEARLTARLQDDFRRIWSGNRFILQTSLGLYQLVVRLGLWTGTKRELNMLSKAHPELSRIMHRVRNTADFHEIYSHPAFHNPLNRIIDKVIYGVDHVFASIRAGNLPSASFPPTSVNSSTGHLQDLDGPSAASAMAVADELMNTKREYITATSTRKTRMLLQGLLQYWGLYFSFSMNTSQDHAGIPSTSPDLAFALKLLRRSRTSASTDGMDVSRLLDQVFYALYLSRILVLYHFLDSLPSDLSESQAHKEWLYFQLSPPRTSAGVDIFTAVLEGVAGGDVDLLRVTAERKLTALGWRNHRWFSKSLIGTYEKEGFYVDALEEVHPPLYLVIDEIDMPASEGLKTRAARRVARRRAEVYSLLCRPGS